MTCVGKRFGVTVLSISVQVGLAASALVLCQILPSPPATITTFGFTGETATSTMQLKPQLEGSSAGLMAFQSDAAPVPPLLSVRQTRYVPKYSVLGLDGARAKA